MIEKYKKRISGPILDRIDLHVYVPQVATHQLTTQQQTHRESSRDVRTRVINAREVQNTRFSLHSGIHTNSEMNTKLVKQLCLLDQSSQALLAKAIDTYSLSARSYYRIIKIARTIADLSQSSSIQSNHIAEALSYRYTDI